MLISTRCICGLLPNLLIKSLMVSSPDQSSQPLEPVCCKKWYKIVPGHLLVCGVGDVWRTWRIPNWFGTIQNLQRTLIPQTSNWSRTIFAVSYRKRALVEEGFFVLFLWEFSIVNKGSQFSKSTSFCWEMHQSRQFLSGLKVDNFIPGFTKR